MRYRKLDPAGDFQMGHGTADYHVDTPEGVAQAVKTRLALLSGEWFLDLTEGTPYVTHVWGKHTRDTYDPILRRRILQTEGVNELMSYESTFDPETRKITVSAEISTVYGPVPVNIII
ncbi:hypothetical protein HMPREF1022_02303 [Desulfovibrio sp. 6_1_46AFAA]|uniref:hypothetical protein n=1 Tax=Desulfovibrio sp. 6_1_46AFAA TaxID=665942 RepID=UPI0002236D2F|nr:hypothetical protein [Desulfovibrio sp. 6_1_46AFAA]EGW50742.1 hypothetical protein HMPREF1022_02303 [Desulfovibrio sp. 6_1_46AFAA]